jgi:PAS domain S-box-containing protein
MATDAGQRVLTDSTGDSERSLRLLIDSIPGLVATFTPIGELEFVNRQILEYFGRTFEELRHWRSGETTHPEDLPRVLEIFSRSMASGEAFEFETRARRFDGVYRWFQARGCPLRDSNGRIVRWSHLLIDIDDRKRAEEALRERERESRLLINSIPGFVATLTPAGEAELLNDRLLEYSGRTIDELRGWDNNDTIHPEDRPRLIEIFAHALSSGDPYDIAIRFRRFDGVYRWFQTRGLPFRDSNGRLLRWYVLLTDIDDLKRAEEELRRSEAFLVEGQRLARLGNFVWHLETGDISWSEQVYRMFEFEPGTRVTLELIGSRVHPEDLPMLYDMVERAQRGDSHFEYEHRLVMLDNSIKHLHLIAHAGRSDKDALVYIGAVQDVTRRRLAEEALDKARSELTHVARVATVSTLTASIAHEINQPLSGIITNAGTCLRMLDTSPPTIDGAREIVRRMLRDGNRASDVITRLRALFSRREFTLEPLDMNDVTREVVALSLNDLQRNRVVLQSEFADVLPMITGDRVQLLQVILNLLRNASDAMATVHDRPRQLVITTARDADDRVRVTVKDAGVGLDIERMNKLFDAFYTTKTDGMGIGLSVSRSIIERHHGRLWAEPNDGPGATFSFSIPPALASLPDTVPARPS